MTLRTLCEDYIKNKAGILSEQSLYNIKSTILRIMGDYIDKQYTDLTKDDWLLCRSKIADMQVRDGTRRRIWDYLRALAMYAAYTYNYPNHLANIANFKNRAHRITAYIPPEKISTFMSVIDNLKYYCLYALYITTGVRLGELTPLNRSDIDLPRRTINVNKTCCYNTGNGYQIVYHAKTRRSVSCIMFPKWLVSPLEKLLASNNYNYVFCSGDRDEPIRAGTVRYWLKQYCKKAGIYPVTPQGLRKTCACYLDYCAVPIYSIASHLRHSTTKTTELHYLDRQPRPDERTKIALESLGEKQWEISELQREE